MNSRERILTALRRQQPDRVPVLIFLDPYTDTWAGRDPSYGPLLAATREYADVIYDWNFPTGFFASGAPLPRRQEALPEGRTRHVLDTPNGPMTLETAPDWRGGGIVKHWVRSVDDARRVLSIPHAPLRPDLAPFRAERRRLEGVAAAQVTFPDPICLVGDLVAPAVLAVWTVEERGLLCEMLDVACRRIAEALNYCLAGDVGPIYYFNGPEYALPPLMSPRDFEEFVVAYDRRLVELIHSRPERYVIIHSHGRVNRFLEGFAAIGMDGLNVLEPPPMGDTILAEAKARVGDRFCLIGNIQYDDLVRGTAEEVERLVIEAIRQGAPGGGFILCPCASPYERPLPSQAGENLIHYLKMARQHGGYPLRL